MKRSINTLKIVYSLSILLILLSCKKDIELDPSDTQGENPDNNSVNELRENLCKSGLITGSYVDEIYLNGNTSKFHNLYEYNFNSKNQLSEVKVKYVGNYHNGLIKIYKYSYNSEGYLVSRTNKLNDDRLLGEGFLSTTDEFYEYSSGRLAKITYRYKSRKTDGTIRTNESTISYRYDTKGRIISNGEDEFEYDLNGTLISYKNSLSSSYSYTLKDGYIQRIDVGSGDYYTYSYSTKGSLSKEELWSEGKLFGIREFVWDDKKRNINILTGRGNSIYNYEVFGQQILLAESIYHIYFKGWPEYPELVGSIKNNLLQINDTFYTKGGTLRFQSFSDELSYNSSGFPNNGETLTKMLNFGKIEVLNYNLRSYEYCIQ